MDVPADTRLGLGPQRVLRLEKPQFGRRNRHAEVDLADDARGVIGRELIRRYLVLQFLLQQLRVIFCHMDIMAN